MEFVSGRSPLLDALAKLWKVAISFVIPVSVCLHDTTWLLLDGFHEIWYLSIFWKSIMKIGVLLKSDKNNGHFTWRPMYNYDNISLNASHNEKFFKQKLYKKSHI